MSINEYSRKCFQIEDKATDYFSEKIDYNKHGLLATEINPIIRDIVNICLYDIVSYIGKPKRYDNMNKKCQCILKTLEEKNPK